MATKVFAAITQNTTHTEHSYDYHKRHRPLSFLFFHDGSSCKLNGAVMSAAAHTQGPWLVCADDKRNVRTPGHQLIAACCVAGSLPEANARLIAAAPELFDAVGYILDLMPTEAWETLPQFLQDKIRDSYAKAQGGAA
jgi:hypothetical protein